MKKIFIKYNPYSLETEFTIDGQPLPENSRIGELACSGSRLQDWVEELPSILIEECNDNDFDITFHGTSADYEDLAEVLTQAHQRKELEASLQRIAAKETTDKEALIDEVFEQIQQGPFDELRDPEIINAFQIAKGKDFEVCVVATMSAGKSTLINAMLGAKLMPSKQEACTAIITKIKDTKGTNKWKAQVYGKDGSLLDTCDDLTYQDMEKFNSNTNVSTILAEGNIPFVSSKEVSLVLIDTPGPNNSTDPEHERIQSEFLNKNSKSLVLYVTEGTFSTDDNNKLLGRVAKSMEVGGKQSKDRFIFVINKIDGRGKEDGDLSQTLDKVRAHLKLHGIEKANLFPAAALPALNIRLLDSGADLDDDTIDETEMKVRKFNRETNKDFHLEQYASLPASVRKNIQNKLEEAKKAKDANKEALIHTGIPSIEAAIRQYVEKYAKSAKIKNIVDAFMHKVNELGCVEKVKRDISGNKEESERIALQIQAIKRNIDDAKSAQAFTDDVEDTVIEVSDGVKRNAEVVAKKYRELIKERIQEAAGGELSVKNAKHEVSRLANFASRLAKDFQSELDELVKDSLQEASEALLQKYKERLASLVSEIGVDNLCIAIDPVKFIDGSVSTNSNFSVDHLVQSRQIRSGERWVANENKAWYKPWTWFEKSGHSESSYTTEEFVSEEKLASEFLANAEKSLQDNIAAACKYATKQANNLSSVYCAEFKRLDDVLKQKLDVLEEYASDQTEAEERIKEAEERLAWLNQIKDRVASILEI